MRGHDDKEEIIGDEKENIGGNDNGSSGREIVVSTGGEESIGSSQERVLARLKLEDLPGKVEEDDGVFRIGKGLLPDGKVDLDYLEKLKPITVEELKKICRPIDPDDYLKEYCPAGVEKMDTELWNKYYADIQASDGGFDIFNYPGHCPMATVRPMTSAIMGNEMMRDMVIGMSKTALSQYGDTHPEDAPYEFVDIEWVTGYPCATWMYNITFRARSVDNGDIKSFRARVYDKVQCWEVLLCYPKEDRLTRSVES
ncbi:hypothetical protein ACH5RR_000103 [Cinchona calisaya]|uniref:Uncharacterized protein n=1 Tax=Cinchona calisaya TaxID=153742 RepID=A0ABD3AZN9_9GENT